MRAEHISDALGLLADDILEEADDARSVTWQERNPWFKWVSMVACICLLVVGAIAVPQIVGNPAEPSDSDVISATGSEWNTRAHVEHSYVEDLRSIEDVVRYSNNIVQAKLTSVEDFDGIISVYTFEVTEDYTNNTPDEIHVYDAFDDSYAVGHTYHLFLCSEESALYPHTIFTTVIKELVIDVDNATVINGSPISVSAEDVAAVIEDPSALRHVATSAQKPISISNSTDITSVCASADVVAEVRVSNEANFNIYASVYTVDLVSMVKGPETAIPTSMSLPPNLDPNTTYYVFLKETADGEGTYSLFSRSFPVVDSTSGIAEHVVSD